MGDKCSVIYFVAGKANVILVSCASHRLNLAVEDKINESKDIYRKNPGLGKRRLSMA